MPPEGVNNPTPQWRGSFLPSCTSSPIHRATTPSTNFTTPTKAPAMKNLPRLSSTVVTLLLLSAMGCADDPQTPLSPANSKDKADASNTDAVICPDGSPFKTGNLSWTLRICDQSLLGFSREWRTFLPPLSMSSHRGLRPSYPANLTLSAGLQSANRPPTEAIAEKNTPV